MTADGLAAWLRAHGWERVEVMSAQEVEADRPGRRHRYVLANDTLGSMVGRDYWKVQRRR